jgi:hypothetical protein
MRIWVGPERGPVLCYLNHIGLNTGVFYIRNTEWSRSFLLQIASYGTGNGKDREEVSMIPSADQNTKTL